MLLVPNNLVKFVVLCVRDLEMYGQLLFVAETLQHMAAKIRII
jgi:hypothetical protein